MDIDSSVAVQVRLVLSPLSCETRRDTEKEREASHHDLAAAHQRKVKK